MSIDYPKLVPGQVISSKTYVLDDATVSAYRDAVGDQSRISSSEDGLTLVPPMAVAALSFRGVVNDLAIPGGTVHVGQEFEFNRPVAIAETLHCKATVVQNSVRGDWRFLVVRLEVEGAEGRTVMGGKSTIILPEELVSSGD